MACVRDGTSMSGPCSLGCARGLKHGTRLQSRVMRCVIQPGGASFADIVRYLFADAGGNSSGVTPRRGERVAFWGLLNLPACSPADAARVMTATVRDAEDLKVLAGIKTCHGGTLLKPVHHYCCSWALGERPRLAEVWEVVRGSLAAQGLAEHQSLFVFHADTAHRHVHVVVNRVHGWTGLTDTVSLKARVLSRWARSHEEKSGAIRCPARRSAEEDQQWQDLFGRQRTAGTDAETRRREADELAHQINEKRRARGLPPAARPDRHVSRRGRRRGQEYTAAEKARWTELYERHERESTPQAQRRQERRELAARLTVERQIRVRAAAADVKVDILILHEDAPGDAGDPGSIERWEYVGANVIPLAEENQRRTVRARLLASIGCGDIESLLSGEEASSNDYTPPDGLERCLFLERRFSPAARPFADEEDAGCLPVSERLRRRQIRDRAAAVGVPDIEGYARQSPHRPDQQHPALSPHTGSDRGARPREGYALTGGRWDYIEREVIPRWEAIWSFWNARRRCGPAVS